jgi:predicted nuclease of predicted toxin-antitoxin system
MRAIANENIPWPVVEELRRRGHDIAWVVECGKGMSDRAVLELAQRDARVVLTFDKDFGALAFAARLPASCGVVLLRLGGQSPEQDQRRAVDAIEAHDWAGLFAIVEDDRIRVRRLPD